MTSTDMMMQRLVQESKSDCGMLIGGLLFAPGAAIYARTAERTRSAPLKPETETASTSLIAIAAILKSAQFPAHGWIAEVMETPTPVSALLHAGIVNAGGFLVFRFADVIVLNTASMQLLAMSAVPNATQSRTAAAARLTSPIRATMNFLRAATRARGRS